MAYAEIVEEAKSLSDTSASEVLDFIKFLKAKEEKKKTERKSNLLAGGLIFLEDNMISYETLKKETIGLSDDKMATLIAFARFLKSSMPGTNKTMISSAEESSDVESNTGTPKRVIGFLAEDFVSIAPDFDTCLEGLENYI